MQKTTSLKYLLYKFKESKERVIIMNINKDNFSGEMKTIFKKLNKLKIENWMFNFAFSKIAKSNFKSKFAFSQFAF